MFLGLRAFNKMKAFKFWIILIFSTVLLLPSAQGVQQIPFGFIKSSPCPTGYILVPASTDYDTQEFCVAKYEMKWSTGNVPLSAPTGTIWWNIEKNEALTACQSLGSKFDLISNTEWQIIANSIASTYRNWSSGIVGTGEINRGHSDNTPSGFYTAGEDTEPCIHTNGGDADCTLYGWSNQKRTHFLSNDEIIWDFSGNLWEWVSDTYTGPSAINSKIVDLTNPSEKSFFGTTQTCDTPTVAPFCGFGEVDIGVNQVMFRGGDSSGGPSGRPYVTGIFAAFSNENSNYMAVDIGFRCVYRPWE